jgi:hypothetical protein
MFIEGAIESFTFKRTLPTIIALNVLMDDLFFILGKNMDEYVKLLVFLYFINPINYKLLIEYGDYTY